MPVSKSPEFSGAEHEPTPKGFRVEIKNLEEIYYLVKEGWDTSEEYIKWNVDRARHISKKRYIAEAVLDSPFVEIWIEMRSNSEIYEIGLCLYPERHYGDSEYINLDEEYIEKRLKTKKEYGKLFVPDKERPETYSFAINPRPNFSNQFTRFSYSDLSFIVSAGHWNTMASREYAWRSAGPRKLETFDKFRREIEQFAEISKIVVDNIYRKAGIPSPDIVLITHPPQLGTPFPLELPKDRKVTPLKEDKFVGAESKSLRENYREIIRREITVDKPKVSFEEIGGQDGAKREIQSIAFALKNPEVYQKWGTKPPKGVLLYGPPGNGKTLLAKALASEAEANFFHVEISDIVSKWYGESEQLMKAVFEEAESSSRKTIIFFDEMDAIATPREGAYEATRRIVSVILENLDGLEEHTNILVVGSTNMIENVDPALLRPGRMDRLVEIQLPDNEGRKEIFEIHQRKAEETAGRRLFNEIDMKLLIKETTMFSGADIAEIIRRTLEGKVRLERLGQKPGLVTTKDFLQNIKEYERVKETKRRIGFRTPED